MVMFDVSTCLSLQLGLLNGIYGGLGQSIGSLIGGELVRTMGIAVAFYRCAVVDGALLVGYLVAQALTDLAARSRRKMQAENNITTSKIDSA